MTRRSSSIRLHRLHRPACRAGLVALAAALAACDSVPLGPDAPASPTAGPADDAGDDTAVSPVVPDFRPPPEPLQAVQETVSPDCLDLGKPDDSARPDYPRAAARVRQEGWVRFRYDVEAGRLVNPRLMQSSPSGLFDDAVLAWARGLQFPSGRSATGCVMEYEYRLQAVPSAAR